MWPGVIYEESLKEDLLLPVQFRDLWSRKPESGEEELMIAVLAEGIADIRRYRFARSREQQRLYVKAYDWIVSEDTSWPFSFRSLCETLSLSPEAIREDLFAVDTRPVAPTRVAA